MITGEQVKAARKLLGWSQMTLALEANVEQSTIAKFERGESRAGERTVSAIRRALEAAGVEFPGGEPPRLAARPEDRERSGKDYI
jgi:transcriptional regulator with XRE-family HTH domain